MTADEIIKAVDGLDAQTTAPDVVEAACAAYYGKWGHAWPPILPSDIGHAALDAVRETMSAALTAAGIKLAADAGRLKEAERERDEYVATFARVGVPAHIAPADRVHFLEDRTSEEASRADAAEKALAEAVAALENSNSLFAAMLHEDRPRDEIEAQCRDNRTALNAIRARSSGASS